MRRPVVVFYHGPRCLDGICSAWVFWHFFSAHKLSVSWIPLSVAQCAQTIRKNSSRLIGADVFFVDITPDQETVQSVRSRCEKLYIWDHHVSAVHCPELKLDTTKCGMEIAWDELYALGYIPHECPRPWFMSMVRAIDLWEFSSPEHREAAFLFEATVFPEIFINSTEYRNAAPFQAKMRTLEALLHQVPVWNAITMGAFSVHMATVKAVADCELDILGMTVVFIQSSQLRLASDVFDAVCRRLPFVKTVVMYMCDPTMRIVGAVRGHRAVEIAHSLGGGGHARAAGFRCTMEKFHDLQYALKMK